MSETQPGPSPEDDAVGNELNSLFDAFRATCDPPPAVSDEELIAEIQREAERQDGETGV